MGDNNPTIYINIHIANPEGLRNHVLAAMLFGSKARGDADPESDIDLLVLVDVESSEFRSQLWRIASDVSLEYDVVLSPRVFGQERWDETCRIRLRFTARLWPTVFL